MILYIDTEFTSFQGDLISLGIVSEIGHEFYEVLQWDDKKCHPWVLENVIPYLNKDPISREILQKKLWDWLLNLEFPATDIVADWPEDLAFFLELLCKPEGIRLKGEYKFHLIHSPPTYSTIPHNALEDAKALKEACKDK